MAQLLQIHRGLNLHVRILRPCKFARHRSRQSLIHIRYRFRRQKQGQKNPDGLHLERLLQDRAPFERQTTKRLRRRDNHRLASKVRGLLLPKTHRDLQKAQNSNAGRDHRERGVLPRLALVLRGFDQNRRLPQRDKILHRREVSVIGEFHDVSLPRLDKEILFSNFGR